MLGPKTLRLNRAKSPSNETMDLEQSRKELRACR